MTNTGSRPPGENVIAFPHRRRSEDFVELGAPPRPERNQDRRILDGPAAAAAASRWALAARAEELAPLSDQLHRPHVRRDRHDETMLTVLIDLEHSYPPVWRRVEVASDLRLDQLHEVIVGAMGWQDIHLHEFRSTFHEDSGVVLPPLLTDAELDVRFDAEFEEESSPELGSLFGYGSEQVGEPADEPGRRDAKDVPGILSAIADDPLDRIEDRMHPISPLSAAVHESAIRLGEVLVEAGDVLTHVYDLTSGWRHILTVEQVRPRTPGEPRARLLEGEQACPPEDCGGTWTYNDMVALLADEDDTALQTHPDDVLDQLDWLPAGFDPATFDVADARDRVEHLDLLELPPPMPPLEVLTPALGDLIASCDTRGRRAAAHLLSEARLDAPTLVQEYAAGTRRAMVAADAALAAVSGAGAQLPDELDEAACASLVAPFRAVVDAAQAAGPAGFTLASEPELSWRLITAAVALGLVRAANGTVQAVEGPPVPSARALATLIARRLPLGARPHEVDAGAIALLCAAAGFPRHDVLDASGARPGRARRIATLCRTVIVDAGWRTRAGRVSRSTIAFWADETWSVLSFLSGGAGVADPGGSRFSIGGEFPHGVAEPVRVLAAAALRLR